MGEIEEFVGCTIKPNPTKRTLNIYQPHLINKTTQGFNKDMKSLMKINTQAKTHKGIVSNKEIDTKIEYDLQKRYRSGVGLLLYHVKHLQPKLSNVIRAISICTDESNMNH